MFNLKLTKQTFISFCLLAPVLHFSAQVISAQISIGGITITKPKRPDKPKTGQPEKTTSGNDAGVELSKQEETQTNPHAPADYNANLNVGDQAVAVDRFSNVTMVRIIAKSDGGYKVAELKSPDSAHSYSTNSVYPYFNYQAFTEIVLDNKTYVTPYLPCYGKKHNLNAEQVTVEGYNAFGARHFDDAKEAQTTLQAEQPKLAELESLLKSKLGGGAPNTFLDFMNNPAIVSEIVAQRAEYLKCAVGVEHEKPDFRLAVFLSDIKKAQGEAERYSPGEYLYLVSAGDASDELLRAVSRRAREEWAKAWLKNPASRTEFDAEWDKLAAIAARKIPTYKPSAASYRFRDAAGEKLLMGSLKSPSTLKIFRIGTDTAGWNIEKGNNETLPSYRYKTMKVYFRDPNDDHPYCRVVSARIKQDYAGGGSFKSEVYSSSAGEEIFGCP
jgi:hypothetical protein